MRHERVSQLTDAAGAKRMRLLGFERVELEPGESKSVMVAADPRLLARFDGKAGQWRIADGTYKVPSLGCAIRLSQREMAWAHSQGH